MRSEDVSDKVEIIAFNSYGNKSNNEQKKTLANPRTILIDLLSNYCLISDVIGNLTALQTLDLSHNDISDLSDRDVFLPPLNLSNLYLSNNHLDHVPLNKILPLAYLKVLDLEENEINVFDEKFMKIIQNGTVLRYSGNSLLSA